MRTHPATLWCWAVPALLAALAAGCDRLPGKPNEDDRELPPGQVRDFDTLFRQNCAGCHGADGRLGPAPPLNDPLFLQIVPDEELLMVISDGRQGTLMPAFAQESGGPLGEEQVRILAEGIKPRWKPAGPPRKGVPPYAEEKEGDPEAGKKVFAVACASCHGDRGQGHPGDAGAINDPAFLALASDSFLRRIVITGRPDLGMPSCLDRGDDRPDSFEPLTSRQVADVAALLASWRPAKLGNGK